MSRRRIYIAGPMRGRRYYNFPAFDEAKRQLEANGWEVVSPADIDRATGFDPLTLPDDHDWRSLPEGFDLRLCVERDIAALLTCEAIYLLDGWDRSRGAKAEQAVAEWLGLEIIHEWFSEPQPETILDEALRITSGDRNGEYGHPAEHFARTTGMLNAMFGTSFKPEDWPLIMCIDKLARQRNKPKRDNLTDIAGYARCAERVMARAGMKGYAA